MNKKLKYKNLYINPDGLGQFDILELNGDLVDGCFNSEQECIRYIDETIYGEHHNDVQAAFDGLVQTPQC